MTVTSMIKTTGENFRYTGQAMLYVQNFGFFFHDERPLPLNYLWDENYLIKESIRDLFISAVVCGVFALLGNTIAFTIVLLFLLAPTIALLGLGLSYLGQKLEENNAVNIQPAKVHSFNK